MCKYILKLKELYKMTDNKGKNKWFEPHAGLDESGKGDLFGPLVSACVISDGYITQYWIDIGIKDSKKIKGDKNILKFDNIIRNSTGVTVKTAFTSMRKYNDLYKKFQSNLNFLLAWLHATSLREALLIQNVSWGMLDQFSKSSLVQKYFEKNDFDLKMEIKAEEDPVVAAASIVARAEYLRQMNKLSEKIGEILLRGSNQRVKIQAKNIIEKFGKDKLIDYAKLNFKTAKEAFEISSLNN